MAKATFGQGDPVAAFKAADGIGARIRHRVYVTPTGDDWCDEDEYVGEATSWAAAKKLIHEAGYRIMYSGGCFCDKSSFEGEDGYAVSVTVYPK